MRHSADRPRGTTSLSMKGRPPPDAVGGARKGGRAMIQVRVDLFDVIAYGMIGLLMIGLFAWGIVKDWKKEKENKGNQ